MGVAGGGERSVRWWVDSSVVMRGWREQARAALSFKKWWNACGGPVPLDIALDTAGPGAFRMQAPAQQPGRDLCAGFSGDEDKERRQQRRRQRQQDGSNAIGETTQRQLACGNIYCGGHAAGLVSSSSALRWMVIGRFCRAAARPWPDC
jgi:hypothetical protein